MKSVIITGGEGEAGESIH